MALCLGAIAAVLFVAVSSCHLTAQGLYYDELHQATAAFAYVRGGPEPEMFAKVTLLGLPVLNMTYSGAIKTAIYGLFLRYSGAEFSVLGWRLLGIVLVSSGLFVFCVLAGHRLPLVGLLVFLVLFLTDATVVLATRHDWGPAALALVFRLLFIAVWLRGETSESPGKANSFFLGALVGISIFEKLSSIVLAAPLILILTLSADRRRLGHCAACFVGALVGGMPLILVNLYTFVRSGYFVSLTSLYKDYPQVFSNYVYNYLTLGNGTLIRLFILDATGPKLQAIEGLLMSGLLFLIVVGFGLSRRRTKLFRMAFIMLLCYAVIGISLYFFPRRTQMYHWLLGTPFQYAALSLFFCGLDLDNGSLAVRDLFGKLFSFVFIILLMTRGVTLAALEISLFNRKTSIHWHPSFTQMAWFATGHADRALFIAADWGLATQIYCISNGRSGLVQELFLNYGGLGHLRSAIESSGKPIVYVLVKRPRSSVRPEDTTRILEDMMRFPGWTEVPAEPQISMLEAVAVRKFARAAN